MVVVGSPVYSPSVRPQRRREVARYCGKVRESHIARPKGLNRSSLLAQLAVLVELVRG